ncbi:PhlD [Actinacidiphila sp. DG2A-62]|uniref:PhlD n=1 Tax=Actinacidiphila sp. DG2A-62 TaxID=3108821 RepID=UPI002DBC00C5|nr:PhlD [Actinacidiphila sp. DG2A-62]MEC3997228.1 PhlD [Actinacidiphila sp. DG2A-62]
MLTSEIAADLEARHPGHPRLAVWLRMLRAAGVVSRPWVASLEKTAALEGVGPRSRAVWAAVADLAEQAAISALAVAGLDRTEVDAVVTTHSTSWTVPGLEVEMIRRLGLRPDVTRVPLTTLACAGGVHALVQAARITQARPGSRVLVVAAEALSTLYHPEHASLQTVLYGGLFGDCAAATVVVGDEALVPEGAGSLCGEAAVWEWLQPDSGDRYWSRVDADGLHFDSGPRASRAAGEVLPHLTSWLDGRPVEWAAVHPGGPGIIAGTVQALGLPETAGRHSFASLSGGNLGGPAVLDVLQRTLAAGDAKGPGLVIGFGPGFSATALYLDAAQTHSPGPDGGRGTARETA